MSADQVTQKRYEPYLCVAPACGLECCGCNHAISPADMRHNAVRYALLQRIDPRFGMPVEWLKFKTLDEAVDAELAKLKSASTGDCKSTDAEDEQLTQINREGALAEIDDLLGQPGAGRRDPQITVSALKDMLAALSRSNA